MSIIVDTMISNVQRALGVDEGDAGFDTPGVLLLLNKSWWEIQNKFNFREKETSYIFPTIVGTNEYAVPTLFEAIRLISIEDPIDEQHTPLTRITVRENEMEFINSSTSYDMPTSYFRYNNKIHLLPTPDQVYNITVYHRLTLADLATGNYPPIPQEWHEIIEAGAIYRGYKDLADFTRAKAARQDQLELINTTVPVESKEEMDSANAGLDIPAGLTVLGYTGDF